MTGYSDETANHPCRMIQTSVRRTVEDTKLSQITTAGLLFLAGPRNIIQAAYDVYLLS